MRTFLICVAALCLTGCFTKPGPRQSEVWPVYQVPSKPTLNIPQTVKPGQSQELDMMIKSLYDVVKYSESLNIVIETHNTAARAHNTLVEQELGIDK